MKKFLVFVLFTFAMLFLVGCNVSDLVDKYGDKDDENNTTENNENNGNNNQTSSTVSQDHKAEEVEEKIQALIDINGLFLKYEYHAEESDGETATGAMAFGADGDIYYIMNDDEEAYFDFSDNTKLVSYRKYDGEWSKEEMNYNEDFTREQAEEVTKAYASMVTGFMTMYQAYEELDTVKTSDTVAGRACDKYTTVVTTFGVSISYSFSLDKTTGVCLKWDVSGYSTEGNASVTFECKEFKTNFKITLPVIVENND